MVAAGGLRSDADDMLTLLAAHLGFVPTPLKPVMDGLLVVRAEGDGPDAVIGIGWMIATTRVGTIVTHGGATTAISRMPRSIRSAGAAWQCWPMR